MSLEKFKKELDEVTDPAIKKVGEYLLTRDDIHKNLEKENKSLDEMWNYVLGEAEKLARKGRIGTTDETVFGWAVHYYDENKLTVGLAKQNVKVLVTDENMQQDIDIEKYKNESKAKDEEIKKLKAQLEQKQEVKTPPKKEKKAKSVKTDNLEGQLSLFDVL